MTARTEHQDRDGKPSSAPDLALLYMAEMARIPVLTAAQEVEAFRRVESTEADLIRHLMTPDRFSRAAVQDLVKAFSEAGNDPLSAAAVRDPAGHAHEIMRAVRFTDAGREWLVRTQAAAGSVQDPVWASELRRLDEEQRRAKAFCVSSNLRLVIIVARKYVKSLHGMTMNDLIQEGNFGLMKAVEKFDVERGYKFVTYAMWWIRANVKRAIQEKERLVRVPVHLLDYIQAVSKAEAAFFSKHGRDPSVEELAAATKMPVEKVSRALGYRHRGTSSLDAPVPEAGDASYLDITEDESNVAADEAIQIRQTEEAVSRMFTALTPQESQILRWRFGFDGQDPLTLAEIGLTLCLSRERIRQIEARALQKLRDRGEIRQYR